MASDALAPDLGRAFDNLAAAYATRDIARQHALAAVDQQHAELITRRHREYQAARQAAQQEGTAA